MLAGLVDRLPELSERRGKLGGQELKTKTAAAAVQNHLVASHLGRPHGTTTVRLVEHEVRRFDALDSPAGLERLVEHQVNLAFAVR